MNESRWNDVALAKLSNVLGNDKAREVHAAGLRIVDLEELRSPDDLYRFAQHVMTLGGFAGTVGALLSVHAVIHGAADKRTA